MTLGLPMRLVEYSNSWHPNAITPLPSPAYKGKQYTFAKGWVRQNIVSASRVLCSTLFHLLPSSKLNDSIFVLRLVEGRVPVPACCCEHPFPKDPAP